MAGLKSCYPGDEYRWIDDASRLFSRRANRDLRQLLLLSPEAPNRLLDLGLRHTRHKEVLLRFGFDETSWGESICSGRRRSSWTFGPNEVSPDPTDNAFCACAEQRYRAFIATPEPKRLCFGSQDILSEYNSCAAASKVRVNSCFHPGLFLPRGKSW
jgi:hypothetical protein